MPYDSEAYFEAPKAPATTPPKHNMERLIDHLGQISDDEYSWVSTGSCVMGHAARMAGERLYSPQVAAWLGLSAETGADIFIGMVGANKCRTRHAAIRHLRGLIRRGAVSGLRPPPRRSPVAWARSMLSALAA